MTAITTAEDLNCLVEFGNGFYEGEWRSGKREGLGVFMWDSGTLYIGNWHRDLCEGEGAILLTNGGSAYGQFLRGSLTGQCCVISRDGSKVVGEFDKGVLLQGTYQNPSTNKWYMLEIGTHKILESMEITGVKSIPQILSLREFLKQLLKKFQSSQKPMKCLDTIQFTDNEMFYIGMTNQQLKLPAGLGAMLNGNDKHTFIGHFQGRRLHGIGRQHLDSLINDGIFNHGCFQFGAQYFVNDEKFFYGYFQGNKLNKILKSGKGYPRKLFGVYKHPSKFANVSSNRIDKNEDLLLKHFKIPNTLNQDQNSTNNVTSSSPSRSPYQISPIQYYYSQQQQSNGILISSDLDTGYLEIYQSSPKKRNPMIYVENKYSEEFSTMLRPSAKTAYDVIFKEGKDNNNNKAQKDGNDQESNEYIDNYIQKSQKTISQRGRQQNNGQTLKKGLINMHDRVAHSLDHARTAAKQIRQNKQYTQQGTKARSISNDHWGIDEEKEEERDNSEQEYQCYEPEMTINPVQNMEISNCHDSNVNSQFISKEQKQLESINGCQIPQVGEDLDEGEEIFNQCKQQIEELELLLKKAAEKQNIQVNKSLNSNSDRMGKTSNRNEIINEKREINEMGTVEQGIIDPINQAQIVYGQKDNVQQQSQFIQDQSQTQQQLNIQVSQKEQLQTQQQQQAISNEDLSTNCLPKQKNINPNRISLNSDFDQNLISSATSVLINSSVKTPHYTMPDNINNITAINLNQPIIGKNIKINKKRDNNQINDSSNNNEQHFRSSSLQSVNQFSSTNNNLLEFLAKQNTQRSDQQDREQQETTEIKEEIVKQSKQKQQYDDEEEEQSQSLGQQQQQYQNSQVLKGMINKNEISYVTGSKRENNKVEQFNKKTSIEINSNTIKLKQNEQQEQNSDFPEHLGNYQPYKLIAPVTISQPVQKSIAGQIQVLPNKRATDAMYMNTNPVQVTINGTKHETPRFDIHHQNNINNLNTLNPRSEVPSQLSRRNNVNMNKNNNTDNNQQLVAIANDVDFKIDIPKDFQLQEMHNNSEDDNYATVSSSSYSDDRNYLHVHKMIMKQACYVVEGIPDEQPSDYNNNHQQQNYQHSSSQEIRNMDNDNGEGSAISFNNRNPRECLFYNEEENQNRQQVHNTILNHFEGINANQEQQQQLQHTLSQKELRAIKQRCSIDESAYRLLPPIPQQYNQENNQSFFSSNHKNQLFNRQLPRPIGSQVINQENLAEEDIIQEQEYQINIIQTQPPPSQYQHYQKTNDNNINNYQTNNITHNSNNLDLSYNKDIHNDNSSQQSQLGIKKKRQPIFQTPSTPSSTSHKTANLQSFHDSNRCFIISCQECCKQQQQQQIQQQSHISTPNRQICTPTKQQQFQSATTTTTTTNTTNPKAISRQETHYSDNTTAIKDNKYNSITPAIVSNSWNSAQTEVSKFNSININNIKNNVMPYQSSISQIKQINPTEIPENQEKLIVQSNNSSPLKQKEYQSQTPQTIPRQPAGRPINNNNNSTFQKDNRDINGQFYEQIQMRSQTEQQQEQRQYEQQYQSRTPVAHLVNSSLKAVKSFRFISEQEDKEEYNNFKCTFSRQLQDSINQLVIAQTISNGNSSKDNINSNSNNSNNNNLNQNLKTKKKQLFPENIASVTEQSFQENKNNQNTNIATQSQSNLQFHLINYHQQQQSPQRIQLTSGQSENSIQLETAYQSYQQFNHASSRNNSTNNNPMGRVSQDQNQFKTKQTSPLKKWHSLKIKDDLDIDNFTNVNITGPDNGTNNLKDNNINNNNNEYQDKNRALLAN